MSDIDLESAISQFYEDESLTEALTDQPANTLLKWGEEQLQALAQKSSNPDEFDVQFTQLRKLIKSASRFIAEHQNMAADEQHESMEKIIGFAQNLGLVMGNAVAGIIEEQKTLADNDSVAHFIAQFATTVTTSIPTPPSVPMFPEISPIDPNAPVEDITEILPKGGLMDFIKQITNAVKDTQQSTTDDTPPSLSNPSEGLKPSGDEF